MFVNQSAMVVSQQRFFFGSSKKEQADVEDKESKDEAKEKEKEEEQTEGDEKKVQDAQAKEDEKDKEEGSVEQTSEEEELSSEDIKKIKALITEQDETIESHENNIEELKKDIKMLKQKLAYQLAENDNTVKRYRKQIEDGKLFAISKFAKELLDVRDNLDLALQHVDLEKVDEMEEIEQLKI